MKCQLQASSPFVFVRLIDYSLEQKKPTLSFIFIWKYNAVLLLRMSTLFHVVTSPSVSGSLNALGLFLVV